MTCITANLTLCVAPDVGPISRSLPGGRQLTMIADGFKCLQVTLLKTPIDLLFFISLSIAPDYHTSFHCQSLFLLHVILLYFSSTDNFQHSTCTGLQPFAPTIPPDKAMTEGSVLPPVSTVACGSTKSMVVAKSQNYSMEVACRSFTTLEDQYCTSWVVDRWNGEKIDRAADPLLRYVLASMSCVMNVIF